VTTPPFLFDASTAGVIDLAGRDREAFLQGLCTNDVRDLAGGGALWAAALTPTGKVRFLFRAARRGDRIRLLLEPDRAAAAGAHFRKYAVFQDVRIEEPAPPPVRFDFYGAPPALPGTADSWPSFFEISASALVSPDEATAFGESLREAGGERIAESDREARRIEAGRPRDGVDVDETRTPDEAGLGRAVSATKGCYVGQEVVARMRTYGRLPRRLVGFAFSEGPAPPPGSRLVASDGNPRDAGIVTSAAVSPQRGAIGLGYAARDVPDGAILGLAEDPGRQARVFAAGGA
jgi:folate-binding protein YgfZ